MSRNIVELQANKDVSADSPFEATFPPVDVDEILLEFDPKHSGPPLIVLSNSGGATKEVHPMPQRGREGRFVARFPNETTQWSAIRVGMLRGKRGRLVKVKLVAKTAGSVTPAPQG
jgi:hypothetical protein